MADYHGDMNEVQQRLEDLRTAGWSDAAVGDAINTTRVTVARWRSGVQSPGHSALVLAALDGLLKRKPPPRRRYPGTHHLQRRRDESGDGDDD